MMNPFPDRAAEARYSGTKMLNEALADTHVTFEAKAALVLDWIAKDATDEQAEALGNRIGRIPGERKRQ